METDDGFIEFTEYIDEAIDWKARPCASWREVIGTMQTAHRAKARVCR